MTKNRLKAATLILLIIASILPGCGSQASITTSDTSELRKEKLNLDNYNSASSFWKMADAEIPTVTYEQAIDSDSIGTYVCIDTIGVSSEEFDAGIDSWQEVDVELAIPKEDGSYYSYKNDVVMATGYMFKFGYNDLLNLKEGDKIRLCLYVADTDLDKDYIIAAKDNGMDSTFDAEQYAKNASAQEEIESSEDSSSVESNTSTESNSTSADNSTAPREYDALQTIFLNLTTTTTEDELIQIIQDNGVVYTEESYNGDPGSTAYKIAYTEGAAQQSHADSGDYLQVDFNADDGSFMYAEYGQKDSFRIALFYNYGIYWDFRETAPGVYSGYYYYTAGDTSKTGITIKYSNGNEVKTAYHKVDSAEEALPL